MSNPNNRIPRMVNFTRRLPLYGLQKLITTLLLLAYFFQGLAQGDIAAELQQKFDIYRKETLLEKLYVHTDKSVYLTGEVLWFKVYAVDAFFHKPLPLSSVAYVEILDKNNKAVLQSKISLKKGDGYCDGNGSFFMPASINSGNYKLRAYTSWMKNFSADYFFEKSITIYNPQKGANMDSASQTQNLEAHIDFFPEGGNLVSGLVSKVAFCVTDQYGKGLSFQGLLLSTMGDTILSFHPLKFGMGNFSFTPALHHNYKAVIRLQDGTELVKEMPPAYDQGYVMGLGRSSNNQLEIIVRAKTSSNLPLNGQGVYLFILTRGSVKWVAGKTLENGQAVFLVDSPRFGEGISQITVFNSNKQPVCERLFFHYPKNSLQLRIITDHAEYSCRKKINVDIFSGIDNDHPLAADLSLAVYRVDSLQNADPGNIENYLWLSGDLRGSVESPAYYFNSPSPETTEAMDNLMLTQGWRRFKWEDVLANKKPTFEFLPEYNGHLISGKIMDSRTGLPIEHTECYISVPGVYPQFQTSLSDDQGRIRFEMKNFYGSREIIVQTNPRADSGYTLDIQKPFSGQFSSAAFPRFSMPDKKSSTLRYASINTQAQDLYLGGKIQQFIPPTMDTLPFYQEPDERYLLDNYTRFTTMEEVIREYVKGVGISKTDGSFSLSVVNDWSKLKFNEGPLVLLDGVPVYDIDKFIKNYDPLKLYKLEVLRREYFLGYKSFAGILNFSTYAGDLAGYELDPGAVVLDYKGLELQRKFYAPVYESKEQTSSHLPDFRNLLYWEPGLKTDLKGKAQLGFYASDLPGKYAVVVQGLDQGGKLGSGVIFFEVIEKSK
jgi:hypothetical protein